MNTEQINMRCAELDGYENIRINDRNLAIFTKPFLVGDRNTCLRAIPDYTTSYDAIIPLIQKQSNGVMLGLLQRIDWKMNPAQLCEALLRATGKWEEAGLSRR